MAMIKKILMAGGVASVMALAIPAQAQVTSWTATVDAGFSSYTSTAGGTTGITASANNVLLGDPTALAWPSGSSPQSGLSLSALGHFSGTILTGNAPVNTTIVTANNHPINGTSLIKATIHDQLVLTPLTPPAPSLPTQFLNFDIAYDETPNTAPCAATPIPSNNPCPDILAIVNLQNGGFDISDPSNVFITQKLTNYGGEDYTINLFITGLILLNSTECSSVEGSSGLTIPANQCIGFISQENNDNTFQASLQILDNGKTSVPEPATIALFGSGLFGLGGLIKRRRKAKSA
jgi:hypothetical protein